MAPPCADRSGVRLRNTPRRPTLRCSCGAVGTPTGAVLSGSPAVETALASQIWL